MDVLTVRCTWFGQQTLWLQSIIISVAPVVCWGEVLLNDAVFVTEFWFVFVGQVFVVFPFSFATLLHEQNRHHSHTRIFIEERAEFAVDKTSGGGCVCDIEIYYPIEGTPTKTVAILWQQLCLSTNSHHLRLDCFAWLDWKRSSFHSLHTASRGRFVPFYYSIPRSNVLNR